MTSLELVRRHSKAWQGICPVRNDSALPAALSFALSAALSALLLGGPGVCRPGSQIIRLFIKCKLMAFWLTESGSYRISNMHRGPNLIALRDAGGFYSRFYGKLKLLLWAVSVSCYAASVAFQTPVVENKISIIS